MKAVAGAALVTLLLLLPERVFALATEIFGNSPVVKQPEWAEGILDVVNLESRVYSVWINGNEKFFYSGNRQALNQALRRFASVKDDVCQLILLPGPGTTQSLHGKKIDFDWQLHVPSGIYKAVAKKSHAVMTVFINAAKPRGQLDQKRVEKWLGELDSDVFQTRETARKELQKLGKDAKPFLREALKTRPSPEAERRIESLLEELRVIDVSDLDIPRGITVLSVDDLLALNLKGLKDPDRTVCGTAIQELSVLAPYSDKVVPAIAQMLKKGHDQYVRLVAAACLAQVGAKAKPTTSVLKEGIEDPDATIRNAFQSALDRIEKSTVAPGDDDEVKRRLSILKELNERAAAKP
jgi:hypothetical protein